MGKWYNKIFIGNPDKEDFTAKDLPNTRMDQFFDVIKLRFGGLITANLIVAIFMIPLLLWAMFIWFNFTMTDTEGAMKLIKEDGILTLFLLVNIPLYTLMGPAQAGLYYCIRNWIWNRRATVGEHFWMEFKRSWKQSLFLNFFNATLFFAGYWWFMLCYVNIEAYPILQYVSIGLVVVLLLYYMSTIYQFPQLVCYNLKVTQILKNSIIYMIVQFPRTLAACLIYALLMIACVMLNQVLLAVAMSLGLSFACLANMILSDFLFDKYVNAPEDRRKGMAPKE